MSPARQIQHPALKVVTMSLLAACLLLSGCGRLASNEQLEEEVESLRSQVDELRRELRAQEDNLSNVALDVRTVEDLAEDLQADMSQVNGELFYSDSLGDVATQTDRLEGAIEELEIEAEMVRNLVADTCDYLNEIERQVDLLTFSSIVC